MLLVDIFFRSLKPKTEMPFKFQGTIPASLSPDGLQDLPLSKTKLPTHLPISWNVMQIRELLATLCPFPQP